MKARLRCGNWIAYLLIICILSARPGEPLAKMRSEFDDSTTFHLSDTALFTSILLKPAWLHQQSFVRVYACLRLIVQHWQAQWHRGPLMLLKHTFCNISQLSTEVSKLTQDAWPYFWCANLFKKLLAPRCQTVYYMSIFVGNQPDQCEMSKVANA